MGAVPQEVVDACFTAGETTGGAEGPTDIAWGPEAANGSLDFMTLNAPEVLTSVGAVDFTSFIGGCDFANNDFTQLYCADNGNALFTLSTTNAAKTVIGPLSPIPPNGETVSGFAWDGTTSTMYVCTTNVSTSSLLTVDLATGATTLVGTISGSAAMIACAVDANGDLYGYDIIDDNLYAIDKATGAGTVIGPIGFDANFGQGMDFDHDGNTCYLFAFNSGPFLPELRTCDTSTGATTLVGVIGATSPAGLVQLPGAGIQTPDVPVELMSLGVE
jgi:hypothetical protein